MKSLKRIAQAVFFKLFFVLFVVLLFAVSAVLVWGTSASSGWCAAHVVRIATGHEISDSWRRTFAIFGAVCGSLIFHWIVRFGQMRLTRREKEAAA